MRRGSVGVEREGDTSIRDPDFSYRSDEEPENLTMHPVMRNSHRRTFSTTGWCHFDLTNVRCLE